jgi:hypothetical protein
MVGDKIMTRILRTYGQGFGDTDAAVTVKFEDQIVFSGAIPTKAIGTDSWQLLPDGEVLLFEFEIPDNIAGNHSMQYEMLAGTAVFSSITSNFAFMPNPVWSEDERNWLIWQTGNNIFDIEIVDLINSKIAEPLTQEQIDAISNDVGSSALSALLANSGLSIKIRSSEHFDVISSDDPRRAVMINGYPVAPARTLEQTGTWYHTLQAPDIMQFAIDLPDISA